MKQPLTLLIALVATILLNSGCSKETDQYQTDAPSDYFNMAPGKYILYDLDSTVFVNFGQLDTVIHYQAKDIVDTLVTDNLNRDAWRVIRYIRPAESTNEADWTPKLTYLVIPGTQHVEVVENNMRALKVQIPVNPGSTWKGNSAIGNSPFQSLFQFSNDEDIQYWDYTYVSTNETVTINDQSYPETVSITQVEDSVNVPIEAPEAFAYRNYWNEQYAKGVGLVSKEVSMWEYQPPNGGNPGYRVGFGISMRIREHN